MDSFVLYDFGKDLEHPSMPASPDNIATQIVALPQKEHNEAVHAEDILRLLDRRQSEDATRTATIEDTSPAGGDRKKRARRRIKRKKVNRASGSLSGLVLPLLAAAAAMSLAAAYILLQR